jgi:hypothetical protein
MRFHDFHLRGYSVRKFGSEITLHLVYDYPGTPIAESHIRFADVTLYDFVHTGGAIILDVAEKPLSTVLEQHWDRILHWAHWHGVTHFDDDDRSSYQAKLERDSCRAWDIASAVGFHGFVIAKSIEDVTREYHETPNQAMQLTAGRSDA